MKKNFILTILVFLICNILFGISVHGVPGDVVGNIYSTDIKAFINGVCVDSYNIGGKTVVIVEDITNQFAYYDSVRTLVINDLGPNYLISGKQPDTKKSGTPVGKIYETDIKTFFRGKELTSYSLNGKMAVVVEELGDDNAFSDIGGKYRWSPEERTLSLESMYRYPYKLRTLMEDTHWNIVLTETEDGLNAEPVPAPLTGGYILCETETPDNAMIPIFHSGQIIGYRCSFPDMILDDNGNGEPTLKEIQSPVEYFYGDKFNEMLSEQTPITLTYQDWLNYLENHTLMTVKERFETEDYVFLYAHFSAFMDGTDRLIKLNKADGTRIDYDDRIVLDEREKENYFENVTIDKEKETVTLHYDFDYVIDLKTDEVKAINNLTTDIGIGTDAGHPSEYDATGARNAQYEYKLTAGDVALVVKGFQIPEFYYANMLPLKETFDFFNIKYSFENDILTIDTSEAKTFDLQMTETKVDVMGEEPISYLQVDKVLLNGEETEITYQYISGHFQNTHTGRAKAMPYVCNGKVYINDSFIALLCGK